MKQITLRTEQKTQVVDVTGELRSLVADVREGLVLFSTPHTTAALIVSEDDEELRSDIVKVAENVFASLRPFRHARNSNPNAEAHIVGSLLGSTVVLGIENGQLDLGKWQNILFVELDGPKTREIHVKVILSGT